MCLVTQSCLYHPLDCSSPGASVHGILQAGILQWVAISSSSGSSQPWDWTDVSYVSCIAGRFFASWAIKSHIINNSFHIWWRHHSGEPDMFPVLYEIYSFVRWPISERSRVLLGQFRGTWGEGRAAEGKCWGWRALLGKTNTMEVPWKEVGVWGGMGRRGFIWQGLLVGDDLET